MLPANYDKLITSPIKVLQKQFDFSDTNDVALTKIATKNKKNDIREHRETLVTLTWNIRNTMDNSFDFRRSLVSGLRSSPRR